mgnify:CR=1 FL=1
MADKLAVGQRRNFLKNFLAKTILALAGCVAGKKALAQGSQSSLIKKGEYVTTHMQKGKPPIEPLDTMLLFERSDENNDRPITHEILSLIHEEKGTRSYPWTIYAHLTTHHIEGDACVLCSRLTKNARGWSTGLHSEVFVNAPAVALGMNIEMYNQYKGDDKTQSIGLNIQAHGPTMNQYGIQIHDADGHFEKAIGLNGSGDVGLDVAGKFNTGIHLHGNELRLDEGASIVLDGVGKIRMRYKAGKIEFLNGDKCIAYLDVQKENHEL